MFEAGWLDGDDVAFEAGFFREIGNRINDLFCEQRFPIDLFSCFLRIKSQDRAFGVNDAVADFYFLIFVHEGFGDIGVVSVLDRRATDKRRPIRNRLLLGGCRKIFTGRKNRCRGANGAHRRHKNVLRGDSDNRARRSSVCINEGASRNLSLIERIHDISRRIQPTAVRVHVKNDGGGFTGLGCFYRAPQKCQ